MQEAKEYWISEYTKESNIYFEFLISERKLRVCEARKYFFILHQEIKARYGSETNKDPKSSKLN